MRSKLLFSTIVLLALVSSACGAAVPTTTYNVQTAEKLIPNSGSGTGTPQAGATESTAPNLPLGPAVVDVSQNTNLGPILVDSKGLTLYIYMKDKQNSGESTCIANCTSVWPPFLTLGSPTSGIEIQGNLLGKITRADGSTQVTYNGWPLYYYSNDLKPGDTNSEGMQGVWFVITPDGTKK